MRRTPAPAAARRTLRVPSTFTRSSSSGSGRQKAFLPAAWETTAQPPTAAPSEAGSTEARRPEEAFAEGQETHEHHPEDTKRGDFARGEDRDTDDPDDQEEGADT